jgi:hypothetical protein
MIQAMDKAFVSDICNASRGADFDLSLLDAVRCVVVLQVLESLECRIVLFCSQAAASRAVQTL